ncbi:hypothetical protein EON80_05480 [bacterium]|nr:MAG: hypothetical protein EON80_05480 [bacterium]
MDKSTLTLAQRLRIWETDYGRTAGWLMELRGHPVAILSDPKPEEKPWTSYRFAPVTQDVKLLAAMKTEQFWKELNGITFRSREFHIEVTDVVAAASTHLDLSRIVLRGLAIPIEPPNFLQQQMLKSRKKRA